MSERERVLAEWELVVGMEVHAQLNTRSKLFCACALSFAAEPNTRTCPTCLGLPGALPVLNGAALEKCLRLALALGCRVEGRTSFDRKNYFYPDLPKNYQISQLYEELGRDGRLTLLRSGKQVGIGNVHLEEDAGKLSHLPGGLTAVDLNRAGTPLAEIVTRPDFRSVAEVDDYMETLTVLLRALDVCECRMQEGNLRFEASVSVRPRGSEALGERTEIKNLNSYAAVRRAVTFEQARQVALHLSGRRPRQETRLWDEEAPGHPAQEDPAAWEAGLDDAHRAPREAVLRLLPPDWQDERGRLARTRFMRSKESAHDYRYFPEPDLPVFALEPALIERLRGELPELPGPRRARWVAAGVEQRPAEDLARDPQLSAWCDRLVALGVPPAEAASYGLNQLRALLNARGLGAGESPVPPEHVAELHGLVASGKLPKDLAWKQVWPKLVEEGLPPAAVIQKHGIAAADEGAVDAAVDAAWAANDKARADLLAGKERARGALVGAVMKALQGKASPQRINARLDELLREARG